MADPIMIPEDVPAQRFAGFGSILCAVDGSRATAEVIRQAVGLAAPGGALEVVAVTDARGVGPSSQATLGEHRAAAAVASAVEIACDAGTVASGRVICDENVAGTLLDQARHHDLLVVGGGPHSRAAGILLGNTASRAVHASPVPVLVARPRTDPASPGRVLVATRGADDDRVVEVGAWIAESAGTPVVLGHVGASGTTIRHALARQAAHMLVSSGCDPVVLSTEGSPLDGLPVMAAGTKASLIVLGSRGLAGPRALASVSERVAHRVHCSVLVLRTPQADG